MEQKLVFDVEDIVGESLTYDDRRDALVWVDIVAKRIHRLWLADLRHELWPTPDFPTSIGLRANGGAVVGLRDRVALWDFGGEFRTLAVVEPDLPDNGSTKDASARTGRTGSGRCRIISTPTARRRRSTATAAPSIVSTVRDA